MLQWNFAPTYSSFIRTKSFLILLTAAFLITSTVWADEDEYDSWMISGDSKIWLDKAISISAVKRVILLEVDDATDTKKLSSEVLALLTSIIDARLTKAGIAVLSSSDAPVENSIKLKTTVTKFEAGSAAGRWIVPGTGATECIIRASIISSDSNQVIGEIITWKNVSSGGLFSLGAHEYVPKSAAESIASILAKTIRH